jgi:hypothetical protein
MTRLITCLSLVGIAVNLVGCGLQPASPPPPPSPVVTGTPVVETESAPAPMAAAPGTTQSAPAATTAAPEDTAAPSDAPRGFESPEAAFAAVQQAAKNKDFKAAVGALTDETQEAMCGVMVLGAGLMAAFGGDETADLKAVLEKHGVPIEAPRFDLNVANAAAAGAPPAADEPQEMPIKDKAGFIAEVIAVMEKKGGGEGMDKGPIEWINATLRDLAIDGDKATALVVKMADGAEETEPIEFRRGPGGWLIHMPMDNLGAPPEFSVTASSGGDADAELQMELPEEAVKEGVTTTLKVYNERPFGAFFFGEYPEGALFGLMEIKGQPIVDGFAFGHFQITAAQDDTGKNIKLAVPVQDKFNKEFGEQFVELDHFFLEEKSTLPINFVLEPPGDGAKSLARLEGTIKIKVRSSIDVPDILKKVGTTLTEPKALAEAGEFKIVKPETDDGQPGHVVAIDFIGNEEAVKEMGLVDANGESISTSRSSFGFGNKKHIVFASDEKLPAGTKLRISLAGTDRTVIVPFKFEDTKILSDE